MAQRFGGKYSPEPLQDQLSDRAIEGRSIVNGQVVGHGARQAVPEIRHPHQNRPFWLLLCAGPMLVLGFGAGPVGLARALGGFALVALAEMFTREGLRAEAAYDARARARRPALPRKIIGACLYALGLGSATVAPEMGASGAVFVGLVALALHLMAFGIDPLRHKGMEGIDPFQQDRVARVVAEGERHIEAMQEVIARLGDRALSARVERLARSVRRLFQRVEEEPSDLTAARRYLGVYLQGARDASVKFAEIWAMARDTKARAEYEALLDDLERNFLALGEKLAQGNREGLEIEIEVLRERLAREGIAPVLETTDVMPR